MAIKFTEIKLGQKNKKEVFEEGKSGNRY